jgi:hypothetical protein
MLELLQNKIFLLKTLTVTVLLLIAVNLVIYLTKNSGKSRKPASNFSSKQLTVGVDEDDLVEYAPLDTLIDTLMIREFDVQPGWIRNDRVQLENLMYMRKIVQIPKYFAGAFFNLDLTQLVNQYDWELLSVIEKMGKQPGATDMSIDIGRDGVIYQRIDMVVSPRIRPSGKELFFIVNGFGAGYDEKVKSFLELPETFSIHVPKEQPGYTAILKEAEIAGKPVIKFMPWRNIFYFEEKGSELDITWDFFELLNNVPNRAFIVLSNKPQTRELIRKQFPRAVKKGYIIKQYAERW